MSNAGVGTFLMHPGEDDREERIALLNHMRIAHKNLFGPGPSVGRGFGSPLPESGASELPLAYLVAIHDANHAGLYTDHGKDDWTPRQSVQLGPAYWLSWYSPVTLDQFELVSPWWVSGERLADGAEMVVAAIRASTEEEAWKIVRNAYDEDPGPLEKRFSELLEGSPFSDRFPRSEWMQWAED